MVINQKLSSFFTIFLTIVNALAIFMIAWSSFRGFDLSDECYYYLGYLHLNNSPSLSAASFHLVYDKLFGFLSATLPEVRLLRLVLSIMASLVLYTALKKVIPKINIAERIMLLHIILSGMLLSYGWSPMALSYNTMSSILICLIVGFWLLLIHSDKFYPKLIYAFLVGCLFTFLFFVKITNVLLFLILIGYLLFWLFKRKSINTIWQKPGILLVLLFFLGIFGALVFISGSPVLISQTVENYIQQSFGTLNNDPTHGIEYLKAGYYRNAELVLTRLKYPLILLFLAFAILKFIAANAKKNLKTFYPSIFKMLSGLILVVFVFQNSYWRGGTRYTYLILIPYIYIGIAVLLNNYLEHKKTYPIILLLLLSIPVAGAIGTNNGLSAQVLFYGVFIFLAIYLQLHVSGNTWYKYSVLLIIVSLTTCQISSATIYRPYRQAKLTETTNRLEGVPELNKLVVDTEINKLAKELKFVKALEPQYLFTYSPFAGMSLLAGKKPVSLEWFNNTDTDKICRIIKSTAIAPDNIIFIIPHELPMEDQVLECLEQKGVFLTADYNMEKEIKFYSERYKKTLTLGVYLPKP